MGKGGGGKSGKAGKAKPGAEGGATGSLREQRGKAPAERKDKTEFLDPKRVTSYAILAVVVIVIMLLGWRDGGPSSQPEFAEWSIYAVHADGGEEYLCGAPECPSAPLRAAHEAGHSCRVESRVWLASEQNPMLLVGVRDAVVNATMITIVTEGESLNFTTDSHETTAAMGGWWWRAFPQRVDVEFPTACDIWTFTVALSLEGRSWIGAEWSGQQSASQVVHLDDLERLRPGAKGTD